METANRHPWNEQVTGLLERIALGKAAESIRPESLPEVGAIVELPTWTWAIAAIDVGAKDRGANGERLQLPVQVGWQPGPVVVVPADGHVVLDNNVVGLGHTARGKTVVTATTGTVGTRTTPGEGNLSVPARVDVGTRLRRALVARREQLVDDGKLAYWQTIELLEPIVMSAIRRAEQHVTAEAYDGGVQGPGRALDAADLEAVTNRMLLGEDAKNPGAVQRLIGKCATAAGQFAKVDPQRFIVMAISRDAKAAVRKQVGDPHIGPKVRAMAKQLGTTDLDVLLPAYRQRYPADNLSFRRATDALALWKRPTASHFPIQDTDVPEQSFEDMVAERVDRRRHIANLRSAA